VATSRNFSTGANVPNIAPAFVEKFSRLASQLKSALHKVERHFKSIQEVTFTVENGKLWLLQTKPAKTSARVELKTRKFRRVQLQFRMLAAGCQALQLGVCDVQQLIIAEHL
jgi:hypothetical protein